jgi:hypothetical protein
VQCHLLPLPALIAHHTSVTCCPLGPLNESSTTCTPTSDSSVTTVCRSAGVNVSSMCSLPIRLTGAQMIMTCRLGSCSRFLAMSVRCWRKEQTDTFHVSIQSWVCIVRRLLSTA